MNPYDFVRINWQKTPERHCPVWHHRFLDKHGQPLYAGQIEMDVYTETPLFIYNPDDTGEPLQSMQNAQEEYIIPGSSLKGMLRSLVETLGNGCLTLFDGQYEPIFGQGRGRPTGYKADYARLIGERFQHCARNTELCIACRIFGMLKERTPGVFLGKVHISDACSYDYAEHVTCSNPMYTTTLVEPKPHHRAFYLDDEQKRIAGRKYYFHHSANKPPQTAPDFIYFGRSDTPANKYIQPLACKTPFHFRLDFTNLEADEFGALLLALTLEEDMRHKIGYGKPLGLGTVQLIPMRLTLIDYAARYTPGSISGGKIVLEGQSMWNVLYEHTENFMQGSMSALAMEDLRRIWHWPADGSVDYYYPGKHAWFDTAASQGKRIADTKNVPRDPTNTTRY